MFARQSYTNNGRNWLLPMSHIGAGARNAVSAAGKPLRKLMATLTNSATIPLGTTLLGTSLLDRIGNTPLVRFERLTAHSALPRI